jgi:hypothetical protein
MHAPPWNRFQKQTLVEVRGSESELSELATPASHIHYCGSEISSVDTSACSNAPAIKIRAGLSAGRLPPSDFLPRVLESIAGEAVKLYSKNGSILSNQNDHRKPCSKFTPGPSRILIPSELQCPVVYKIFNSSTSAPALAIQHLKLPTNFSKNLRRAPQSIEKRYQNSSGVLPETSPCCGTEPAVLSPSYVSEIAATQHILPLSGAASELVLLAAEFAAPCCFDVTRFLFSVSPQTLSL